MASENKDIFSSHPHITYHLSDNGADIDFDALINALKVIDTPRCIVSAVSTHMIEGDETVIYVPRDFLVFYNNPDVMANIHESFMKHCPRSRYMIEWINIDQQYKTIHERMWHSEDEKPKDSPKKGEAIVKS